MGSWILTLERLRLELLAGTEANEAAIKFSRKYALVNGEKPKKSPFSLFGGESGKKLPDLVAFTSSFHGKSSERNPVELARADDFCQGGPWAPWP